jgi:hypothetical protein
MPVPSQPLGPPNDSRRGKVGERAVSAASSGHRQMGGCSSADARRTLSASVNAQPVMPGAPPSEPSIRQHAHPGGPHDDGLDRGTRRSRWCLAAARQGYDAVDFGIWNAIGVSKLG